MVRHRFLIRWLEQEEERGLEQLRYLVTTDATGTGFTLADTQDLSLAMGEPCWVVEVEGPADTLSDLLATWQADGLRVDDADEEFHEIDEPREPNNGGGD